MLPFFPAFWAPALAVAAGVIALRAPRAGLALALAAPILPLGNLALGLALLYGAFALGWLALSWRDSRCGLAFLAGPLLAPLGLVALVPLAVQPVRGPFRKAAHALAAVGLAALAAGLRGDALPFGQGAPEPLEVAGTDERGRRPGHRRRRPARYRARGRGAGRDRRRAPLCTHAVADRGPRRGRARRHDPRRARRSGGAARRRRLAHVRRPRRSRRESAATAARPGAARASIRLEVLGKDSRAP